MRTKGSSRCLRTGLFGAALCLGTAPAARAQVQQTAAPPVIEQAAAAPAPGPVAAAAEPEHVVTLRDGAIYRGVLIELVPNDHLVLRLATGELRRIAWADIQSRHVVASAPVPAPVPVPFPVAAQPPTPRGPRAVVHVDSSSPQAELYRNIGSSMLVAVGQPGAMYGQAEHWERICRAPCDTPVDPSSRFQIRGDGLVPSSPFDLPSGQASVTVSVKPGSLARRKGGVALLTAGVLGVTVGLSLALMAPLFNFYTKPTLMLTRTGQPDPYYAAEYMRQLQLYNEGQATVRNTQIGGGLLTVLGAGSLAGGIGLILTSRTRVEVD